MFTKLSYEKIKHFIFGNPHNPHDKKLFHKLSLVAFFAWIGLGGDALSSSSYGPEEAFLALHSHPYLGIFVALASAFTIFIISASYSQIIELFPNGGGGYLVASKLLSPVFGMIAGCALTIDYILTITISIAAGAAALFSILPAPFHHYRLLVAFIGIIILMYLNIRGIKESVTPLIPIFLTFIITHIFVIIYALATRLSYFPKLIDATSQDIHTTIISMGFFGMLFFVLHAYSMGAGTFTGIEAVSNGLPILREPRVKTAKRTMRYMAISLSITVIGLMLAYMLFDVQPHPGKTLNAVLFETIANGWHSSYGYPLVIVALISEAALLFVAAQTGFLGGPRVLANMALDKWMPTRFASLSDRFVIQNGILIMGGAALVMMALTRGSIELLVVLYSINVFITFVLSQLGMVHYWWLSRAPKWKKKILINGIGLILCTFILVSVTILKFNQGGWITLVITGILIAGVIIVKSHYTRTARRISTLEHLTFTARVPAVNFIPQGKGSKFNKRAKTAVLLVKGFNGLGLHSIKNIVETFGGIFKNFVFVEIGTINAGNFMGSKEIQILEDKTRHEVDNYVRIMNQRGYYAESHIAIGIDVVDEACKIVPTILKNFPDAICFGGQIVFPRDSFFSRWLHNYTVFAIQRRLYHQGITVVILPVNV